MRNFTPQKEYFIGIDSDGCVFDSMELKQKECFCPAFIKIYDLSGVSIAAREVWEFVNLYSRTRGVNRFSALVHSMALLRERSELKDWGSTLPDLNELKAWTERESRLSEVALAVEIGQNPDSELRRALRWSQEVGVTVRKLVRNLPPFPQVKQILQMAAEKADLMVLSQTPTADLEREWTDSGIAEYVCLIAGQEQGTKLKHLEMAAAGKYDKENIIMIGDAPGDLNAARANGVLFYPVIPGEENESWDRFRDEALNLFFSGKYAGEYQKKLLVDFETALPERAPWEQQAG